MYLNIRDEALVAWYNVDPTVLYISRRNGEVGHMKVLDIFAYVIYLTFLVLRRFVTACFLCEFLVGV
jgi:hypothetical protein